MQTHIPKLVGSDLKTTKIAWDHLVNTHAYTSHVINSSYHAIAHSGAEWFQMVPNQASRNSMKNLLLVHCFNTDHFILHLCVQLQPHITLNTHPKEASICSKWF